jgi:hypothetical protein
MSAVLFCYVDASATRIAAQYIQLRSCLYVLMHHRQQHIERKYFGAGHTQLTCRLTLAAKRNALPLLHVGGDM